MKKAMKIVVLMAGQYEIPQGARIDFHFDREKDIYVAACERKAFGIAKMVQEGEKCDLENLGTDFSGIALEINLPKRLLVAKIARGKELRMNWMKKN